MAGLCKGGNEPPGFFKANYLVSWLRGGSGIELMTHPGMSSSSSKTIELQIKNGSMSASGSTGPGFDPRRGSKFSFLTSGLGGVEM